MGKVSRSTHNGLIDNRNFASPYHPLSVYADAIALECASSEYVLAGRLPFNGGVGFKTFGTTHIRCVEVKLVRITFMNGATKVIEGKTASELVASSDKYFACC